MTLTELRYIIAVAREQHFGHAAESCFVSQPTLSMGVKKLEEELGITLFERGKGGIAPTPAGARIIEQAQRVLEEAERIKQIARHGSDPLCGPLRVGAIFTIGPYLLPHLIPQLHDTAPRMPLQVDEDYTAGLIEKLKRGSIDVAILSLPLEEPGIVTWPVYDEPFVVVIPAEHPWKEEKQITPQQLATEHPLMLGPGHCFRDQILQICPGCIGSIEETQGAQIGSSLETIRHMVASGLGVTILPCMAAGVEQYNQHLITVKPFEKPVPSRRVALAWRKTFHRNKAIEAIHDAIKNAPLNCIERLDLPQPVIPKSG
ncbi:MAG TPA: hydrogen peroxide-inducible genes activator [Gammaproteobacteria bacterium]|nr:hydrogen peroxide-inducible genes activator [Gammaproteobacteria bacterium]